MRITRLPEAKPGTMLEPAKDLPGQQGRGFSGDDGFELKGPATAPVRLDSWADEPPALATEIEPLRDGERAWRARLEAVRGAKTSIVMTSYYVDADAYGFELVDELLAARDRGVQVILGIDTLVQWMTTKQNSSENQRLLKAKLDALNSEPGFVYKYGPALQHLANLDRVGLRMHLKSMIVDGETAIVGGRNIGHHYFEPDGWSDFDVRMRGPIVGSLGRATLRVLEHVKPSFLGSHEAARNFDRYLRARAIAGAHLDAKDGQVRAEVAARQAAGETVGPLLTLVCSDPNHDDAAKRAGVRSRVTAALRRAFDSSVRTIVATSNFANGTEELRQSLVRAARRGVKVTLVTGSREAAEFSDLAYLAARRHYDELLAAGVEIVEVARMEHGKMYVIDDRLAAFGSYNLDQAADTRVVETLLFAEDPGLVAELNKNIADKVRREGTRFVRPEGSGGRPSLLGALKDKLKKAIARILEPVAA